MNNEVSIHRLKNGIRLLHRASSSDVAHFGLMAMTGTRDEKHEEHGMAHFMEHMFFKGTPKRSPYGIISRIEDVGGEINAYTTKEETALHASFLKEDYRRAMELIQDIFLHSTFPEKEIRKESEVIQSEIQGYEDSPSELIFDRAEEVLFPGHSIGRNILGSEDALKQLNTDRLRCFYGENYASDEIVLSFVGKVPFDKLKKAAEGYFGSIPQKSRIRNRTTPSSARALRLREKRDTYQKHGMLVGPAYRLSDPRRIQLYLLNNILGGPGMNSRLNMALRERRAYSYSAESHYAPYSDTGALMIYFSTDADKYGRSMQVVREEIRKLRSKAIPESRLKHARRQLMGQLAISYDNTEHLMLTGAKHLLFFDRVTPLEETWKKLEAISPTMLLDCANEVLDPSNMNTLIFE